MNKIVKSTLDIVKNQQIMTNEYFSQIRQALNISRREMAKSIGIHPSTLKRFENGERIRRPKLVTQSYANAISLRLVYLNIAVDGVLSND